mgnify:CR=1 FL=1
MSRGPHLARSNTTVFLLIQMEYKTSENKRANNPAAGAPTEAGKLKYKTVASVKFSWPLATRVIYGVKKARPAGRLYNLKINGPLSPKSWELGTADMLHSP